MQKTESQSAKLPGIYRYLYFISGVLLVAIGVIGIFLPILPTTIFLILASACFIKSSPKANEWLKNHKILGMYIQNYQDKSGLTIKSKIFNITLLWLMISVSAIFFTELWSIKFILFAIAIGVTVHLVMIKTKKIEE
ncbi:MAG TPA: YbaN family protein [Ignavibacteriaceae bacterium]|nr:YbaN family protein [Ignavibacteriaceae bacterium]